MSIDKEAKSPQVGIKTSVNSIGLPKSKVTNLLAPMRGKVIVDQKYHISINQMIDPKKYLENPS